MLNTIYSKLQLKVMIKNIERQRQIGKNCLYGGFIGFCPFLHCVSLRKCIVISVFCILSHHGFSLGTLVSYLKEG